MNRIVISGASGDLGRRVTDLLLGANPQMDLTLVTRNTRDFEGVVVRLINPWEG